MNKQILLQIFFQCNGACAALAGVAAAHELLSMAVVFAIFSLGFLYLAKRVQE